MAAWRAGAEIPCAACDPEEPECLLQWAKSSGDHAAAIDRLQAGLDASMEPGGGRYALALAELALTEGDFDRLRADALSAVRLCLFAADRDCELRARRLEAYALSQSDRLSEAIWEAEKSYLLAVQTGTPEEQFKVGVTLARLRLSGLVDLGRVARLLDEIQPLVTQVQPGDRLYALSTRAGLLDHLGYLEQAAVSYAQVRDLAHQLGNPVISASEEFNRIDSLLKSGSLSRSRSQLAAAVAALMALADAQQTPVSTRLRALALLGQLEPERAPDHLSDCLQAAIAIDRPRDVARCAAELAIATVNRPVEGVPSPAELIETARRAAARSGNPNADLEVSRAHTALLWASVPPENALEQSLALLGAEVRRRDRQASPMRQREFLGFLNEDHYSLAARIAAAVAAGQLPAARLGWALGLLESVRGGHGGEAPPGGSLTGPLREWREAATALRGADPRPADLRLAFDKLEAMPHQSRPAAPRTIGDAAGFELGAVRQALVPHQAIVYLQWPPDAGPAWVYWLSRDRLGASQLKNRGGIELALARLASSVGRQRSVAFEQALAELYRALLAPALTELAGTERLIVIPDAALYSVPMLALRRFDSRLEIQVFPSIASWMERERGRIGDRSAWVFANPKLPGPPTPAAPRMSLAPLPGAELEAASLRALLGERARVASGIEATESSALAALSSSAGVVHFATHAVLNGANPQASAVVLAADAENDGWLTLAQIGALDIPPKLIFLSACEAASGRMLTGEGLIGLSAGFLRAGARAVLANLWPVDDAHAAVFVQRVYLLLGRGKTLEQALAGAADDLAQAGYPATAWAGWTIIGDGGSTLAGPPRPWPWALALGIGLLLLAAGAAQRRQR